MGDSDRLYSCLRRSKVVLLSLLLACLTSAQRCTVSNVTFQRYSFQPNCSAAVLFYSQNIISCALAAAVSSNISLGVITSSTQTCQVIPAQCPRYQLTSDLVTALVPSGLTAMELVVLSLKRASGYKVWDLLNNKSTQNYVILPSAPASLPDAFRSSLLTNMQNLISRLIYKRMIVQLYKNSSVVVRLVFDVGTSSGSVTILNWFSKDRLIQSFPVTNLSAMTCNRFSIEGEASSSLQRRFFINFNYGGCGVDQGVMSVLDGNYDNCAMYQYSTTIPRIIYSSDVTKPMLNSITDADYFAILVA